MRAVEAAGPAHHRPATAPAATLARCSRILRILEILAGLIRIGLGALWLHEGIVKVRAGFGRADILLVVDGSTQNGTRVPGFYGWFESHVLGSAPTLFGVLVPVIELGLGVAMIIGLFPVLAALVSVFQLGNYWLSDQVVWQYPVMMILSVVIVAASPAASRFSIHAFTRPRGSG